MQPLNNWKKTMNKTVFVTGANKGIGFGISKFLGLGGRDVIIGARNEERADAAVSQLKSLGVNVIGWVYVDLKDLIRNQYSIVNR